MAGVEHEVAACPQLLSDALRVGGIVGFVDAVPAADVDDEIVRRPQFAQAVEAGDIPADESIGLGRELRQLFAGQVDGARHEVDAVSAPAFQQQVTHDGAGAAAQIQRGAGGQPLGKATLSKQVVILALLALLAPTAGPIPLLAIDLGANVSGIAGTLVFIVGAWAVAFVAAELLRLRTISQTN